MIDLLILAIFPVAQLAAVGLAGWICWALSPESEN